MKKNVSDQTKVCNIFNNYFVSVAKDIGNVATHYDKDFSNHSSIEFVLENTPKYTLKLNIHSNLHQKNMYLRPNLDLKKRGNRS